MKKLKAVVNAVVLVFLAPEFRPFEIRLGRALLVAVLGVLGVKLGSKVA